VKDGLLATTYILSPHNHLTHLQEGAPRPRPQQQRQQQPRRPDRQGGRRPGQGPGAGCLWPRHPAAQDGRVCRRGLGGTGALLPAGACARGG